MGLKRFLASFEMTNILVLKKEKKGKTSLIIQQSPHLRVARFGMTMPIKRRGKNPSHAERSEASHHCALNIEH